MSLARGDLRAQALRSRKPILVIGAGLAGAVTARELADANWDVHVVDKRPHIAGNCYDETNSRGVRFHRYGPHLFHTSNQAVVRWLSRFTEWLPYDHRVSALLPDGRFAPFPINLDTVRMVTGRQAACEGTTSRFPSEAFFQVNDVVNAETYLQEQIGEELTELFFGRYTFKMWGKALREIDASVVKRVSVRLDHEDRYFPNDEFQALPKDGYTAMFSRILSHDKIVVSLGTEFTHEMLADYAFAFLSMPIDEFFAYKFSRLPYR